MYIKTTTYPIMQDEPALGTITESEIIARKYEVEDYLLEEAIEDGIIRDYYDFEDFAIETSQYIDYEAVYDFLNGVEDTNDINPKDLYQVAGVTAPSDRKLK